MAKSAKNFSRAFEGGYPEKVRQRAESLAGRQAAMKLAVSEELWAALERTHTSQAELARRAGVSPQYITKVFSGTTNFTLESVVALFHHLGYELEFSTKAKDGAEKPADYPLAHADALYVAEAGAQKSKARPKAA